MNAIGRSTPNEGRASVQTKGFSEAILAFELKQRFSTDTRYRSA
jgi:hypothetical protein